MEVFTPPAFSGVHDCAGKHHNTYGHYPIKLCPVTVAICTIQILIFCMVVLPSFCSLRHYDIVLL